MARIYPFARLFSKREFGIAAREVVNQETTSMRLNEYYFVFSQGQRPFKEASGFPASSRWYQCTKAPALPPNLPQKRSKIVFPDRCDRVRAVPARLIGQRVDDRFPVRNPVSFFFQNPQLRRVNQVVGEIKS